MSSDVMWWPQSIRPLLISIHCQFELRNSITEKYSLEKSLPTHYISKLLLIVSR